MSDREELLKYIGQELTAAYRAKELALETVAFYTEEANNAEATLEECYKEIRLLEFGRKAIRDLPIE